MGSAGEGSAERGAAGAAVAGINGGVNPNWQLCFLLLWGLVAGDSSAYSLRGGPRSVLYL